VPEQRPTTETIQVWRIALDDEDVLTPARLAWLDRSESMRAERFYGHSFAQRWRVAHVALRELLARATERRPEEVTFVEGAHGKPSMPGSGMPSFSLSHAVDVGLVAIGGVADVGVDVEYVTDAPDLADIAESHFADDERNYIAKLDHAYRVEAFYRCWTRKEAIVKALGVGIGYDLQSFAVSLDTGPERLLRMPAELGGVDGWTIAEIDLNGPYVGALAVRQPHATFHVSDWAPR
jgi:4'-phosphopantetheinyl transferase